MADRDPDLPFVRNRKLYDADFAAWIHDQVSALKSGRFTDLDIAELADEVESLAKRDYRKLESHLRNIIMHMLKWDYQPERQDVSWRKSINASRRRVWGELASSPSFKPRVPDAIAFVFPFAREEAWEETGVFLLQKQPMACPYSFDEIMSRPHELPADRVPENRNDPFQGDLSAEDD